MIDDSSPTADDRVDPAWWRTRQDDHLAAATTVGVPGSLLNALDHLERRRRKPSHPVDPALFAPAALDRWFDRVDHWRDCADFDVLRLLVLWFADRRDLPAHVVDAVRERLVGFRYWYTDPGPEGVVDHRWYWSENHRLIFHTCEHLVGQALPDERFAVTGLTGAEHRDRAEAALHRWFDEKAVDGFSEWHSDSYYEKDLAPLVVLAELAEEPEIARRAAAFADLVLYDLALHSHRDNTGSTHGRSYMRFKAIAPTQTVFSALKLCFDRTDEPWPLDRDEPDELLPATEGATLLARCTRYRPAEAVVAVARFAGELVDVEHMGVELDPGEPLVDDPVRDDGLSYTDPTMVPFWWDRGALTPWQLVPLMLRTLDEHHLWHVDLFRQFRDVRDVLGDDPAVIRQLSFDLHPMINAGLLTAVETVTWRNRHAMLSTAQSYRPGCAGFQHHVSQATLDEHAIVFTNHPGNPPSADPGDYRDDDRYWTGSATLPRAVQHGRAVIQLYSPAFASSDLDVLAGFAYLDETHAYFPTERFDEVHRDGRWTIGRRRDGYVGVWSWRPADWRRHDPAHVFTNGLVGDFDLVAEGAANVWIVEVGDADRWGDLDAFRARLTAAAVEVEDHGWGPDGAHLGFDVRYESPTEGVLELGWTGPLRVDGVEVVHDADLRMDNPFTTVRRGETRLAIDCDGAHLDLDLGRRPS